MFFNEIERMEEHPIYLLANKKRYVYLRVGGNGKTMQVRQQISLWDIIGVIADIQTSFTENFKRLEKKYDWTLRDARLQVVFNCCDLAANARLNIAILGYTKSNGLTEKEWWQKWCGYSPESFHRIPKFELYVDDKCRQYTHRVQEQLIVTTQIYIEAFLRNLARQFNIDENKFWSLKKKFLVNTLKLNQDELIPLTVFQYLKNSLHNKGLHYDTNYPDQEFEINGYSFNFKHNDIVKISWDHIKELIIANSDLLYKIIDRSDVSSLPSFTDKNVVVLTDK